MAIPETFIQVADVSYSDVRAALRKTCTPREDKILSFKLPYQAIRLSKNLDAQKVRERLRWLVTLNLNYGCVSVKKLRSIGVSINPGCSTSPEKQQIEIQDPFAGIDRKSHDFLIVFRS